MRVHARMEKVLKKGQSARDLPVPARKTAEDDDEEDWERPSRY
jgi:hypothetical protein